MKKIAVLTSGGDAPGMNAAIRAVVRAATARGWEVAGVRDGYAGLVKQYLTPLDSRSVAGIIQQGGTILGSARCPEFAQPDVCRQAVDGLGRLGIDAVAIIGGNGSQAGAHALAKMGLPVVGIASTIDNDLYGADVTIGVDTALNVALEAIDRLKVTAVSHRRIFVVEVMGRDCGYLALNAGIAGGAEAVVIPEVETDPERLAAELRAGYERGKQHGIVVVAEGARWDADALSEFFRKNRDRLGFDVRATTLGHVQRGGAPTAFDRLLATRLGAAAVDCLARGAHGVLVGLRAGETATTPLAEVAVGSKPLEPRLFELARVLAG